TFTAIINGGSITQDIVGPGGAGVTIQTLQMSGGTLFLDHPLNLNAGLQYTGGSIFDGMLFINGASTQAVPMDVQGLIIRSNGTAFTGTGFMSFNDGTVTTLAGTITNNTAIFINSAGAFTDFMLNGNVNLTGGGTINVTSRDRFLGNGILTTNNTISGDTS